MILHKNVTHPCNPVAFTLSQTSRESMVSLMTTAKDNNGAASEARLKLKRGPTNSNGVNHRSTQARDGNGDSRFSNLNWSCNFLSHFIISEFENINNGGCGNRLHVNYPSVVPPKRISDEFAKHRQNLPIWRERDQILECVTTRRVTLIVGNSGSGKSTQVKIWFLFYFSDVN